MMIIPGLAVRTVERLPKRQQSVFPREFTGLSYKLLFPAVAGGPEV